MQLQFNFNEKTKLSDWWKKVKENFQTLQDSFNSEASTRANADIVLEGKIAGVQSSIESETQNRQSSEENLQAQINDVRSANNTVTLVGDTNRTLEFVAPAAIPELYWEVDEQYYGDYLSVEVDLHDAFFIDGRKIKGYHYAYDLHLDIGDNLSDFYVVAQYNFVTDQFDAYISREFVPSSVSGDVWTFSMYRYSGIQLEFKVSDDSPTGSYYVLESYGAYYAMPNEDSTGNTYAVSTSFERLRTKDFLATENKNSFLDAINEMTGNISDEETERIAADDALDNKISGKVDMVSGKGLSSNDYTTAEKNKLAGIAAGANNYTHPSSHAASMITTDGTHRFVTDTEKSTWNGKVDKVAGKGLSSNDFTDEYIEKIDSFAGTVEGGVVTGVKGGGESTYRGGNVNITKANIGLGNVDNTSDANKPISTAVQTALNGKASSSHSHSASAITTDSTHRFVTDSEKNTWNSKAPANHTHNNFLAGLTASEVKEFVSGYGGLGSTVGESYSYFHVINDVGIAEGMGFFGDFSVGKCYFLLNETGITIDKVGSVDYIPNNYTQLSAPIPDGKMALVLCLKEHGWDANNQGITGYALVLFVN